MPTVCRGNTVRGQGNDRQIPLFHLCSSTTDSKPSFRNLLVTLKRRDTKKCIIYFLPCVPVGLKRKLGCTLAIGSLVDFSIHYFHMSINNYFSYLERLFLHILVVSLLPLIIPSNRLLSLSGTHLWWNLQTYMPSAAWSEQERREIFESGNEPKQDTLPDVTWGRMRGGEEQGVHDRCTWVRDFNKRSPPQAQKY